jgi:hypothetical protein
MLSITDKIEKTVQAVNAPASSVDARQGERIFNLVYPQQQWTRFRQSFPKLLKRFKDQGFTPVTISFSDCMEEVIAGSRILQATLRMEDTLPANHRENNQMLFRQLCGDTASGELTLQSPIVEVLVKHIELAESEHNPVILFTETEALHPVLRVSAFEQVLQGHFPMPVVFCYPGTEPGLEENINPRFLGIHRPDGNYRSIHI